MNSPRPRIVLILLHSLGCLAGLAVLLYGVYAWNGFHFSFGPSHRNYPGAPDPAAGARWLVILGFTVLGYFAFAVVSDTRYSDPDETDDDSP